MDFIIVFEEFEKYDEFEDVGGFVYLGEFVKNILSFVNVVFYV